MLSARLRTPGGVGDNNHCLPFDCFINSASLTSKANDRGPEMTQSHRYSQVAIMP